ncbi:unnamed protein product, partial [Nesidiocoris tenuis]
MSTSSSKSTSKSTLTSRSNSTLRSTSTLRSMSTSRSTSTSRSNSTSSSNSTSRSMSTSSSKSTSRLNTTLRSTLTSRSNSTLRSMSTLRSNSTSSSKSTSSSNTTSRSKSTSSSKAKKCPKHRGFSEKLHFSAFERCFLLRRIHRNLLSRSFRTEVRPLVQLPQETAAVKILPNRINVYQLISVCALVRRKCGGDELFLRNGIGQCGTISPKHGNEFIGDLSSFDDSSWNDSNTDVRPLEPRSFLTKDPFADRANYMANYSLEIRFAEERKCPNYTSTMPTSSYSPGPDTTEQAENLAQGSFATFGNHGSFMVGKKRTLKNEQRESGEKIYFNGSLPIIIHQYLLFDSAIFFFGTRSCDEMSARITDNFLSADQYFPSCRGNRST